MTEADAVYVKSSPIAGRGLFAKKDIGEGELIFRIAQPMIAVLDVPRIDDTCATCFTWTVNPTGPSTDHAVTVKACARCKQLKFCNKTCQSRAWSLFHKFECRTHDPLAAVNTTELRKFMHTGRAVIRLLLQWEHGTISADAWNDMLKLEASVDRILAAGGKRAVEVRGLGESALWYTGLKGKYSNEFAVHLSAMLQINAFTLITPTLDPIGVVFDPLAACANHSCNPNAVVLMDGPHMCFRSLRPILKDTEILISYVDATNPRSRRHEELKERYYFTCTCEKCAASPSHPEDELRPLNAVQKRKTQAVLAKILKENPDLAPDISQHPSLDTALEVLEKHYFDELTRIRVANIPYLQINANITCTIIEDRIRMVSSVPAWPQHRQPLPALRHELYLNHVCTGRWADAFLQVVLMHTLSDPILYPAPHHPVRAVRLWTAAKLGLLIAEHGAPETWWGVNVGPVTLAYFSEFIGIVGKSHGVGSKFEKMAREKWEDVTYGPLVAGNVMVKGIVEDSLRRLVEIGLAAEKAENAA
ncbi:SET domain-containing protein [Trichodelitschia bisporula]|uniref:SET domain-containing protein n=1 Tax=Trichodelitschia bisporula TaxID=703511 RepID=A0A6G1HP28_9PEZI|nr:SET domain-containing protein [Trichodelitschia bisporula]